MFTEKYSSRISSKNLIARLRWAANLVSRIGRYRPKNRKPEAPVIVTRNRQEADDILPNPGRKQPRVAGLTVPGPAGGKTKGVLMEQGSTLDQEFIDYLLKEKQRLWGEVRQELFEQIGEKLHSEYSLPQDAGDYALIDLLEDTGLAVTDIRHQELIRLDDAIKRVKEGRYGICEDCGEEINRERLRVVPDAPYCIECQKKREAPDSGISHTL